MPFPSPGDLLNPGIEPGSPTLQADALASEYVYVSPSLPISLPPRASVLHVEGSPVANDENHLVETRLN